MFGAILLEEGMDFFTDMFQVVQSLKGRQLEYNWLITDIETNAINEKIPELQNDFCWMSGNELTKFITQYSSMQWMWGVFTGFKPEVSYSEIMKYPLPYANENPDLWKTPLTLQNPLATLEIVCWDSSLVLIVSKKKEIVLDFMEKFPGSRDLFLYNEDIKV
ncbi:hypothetical protein [Cuneatibacter caecimuris]|uniref:Uncharacterized protein n=1 Tax=Cuneatibacter caecimuris TaxID=1796618 RepID=A0A4Q7PK21_9FIRM|nr:hypothetical protein [Cuneatibacter caecimuris]RZT00618.1 hypothetical protein EV209_1942 [Cuneatibacter caecimuris]